MFANASFSRQRPAFLITIDSEGDNLWARRRAITTRNAEFLPRFQNLCESFGLKPTYLANWEMAVWPPFQDLGRHILRADTGEIGMHLHAWNSPPEFRLTSDDYRHHPYLIEYSDRVLREKVKVMTRILEDVFQRPMVSHRAGRWGFNEVYARILLEFGYRVDCSVTPHISWRDYKGNPSGEGGKDYSSFPDHPYFLDLDDISREGSSELLELPLTVLPFVQRGCLAKLVSRAGLFSALGRRVARRLFPPTMRLMPNGRNMAGMLRVLDAALAREDACVEFMLHSSELMPGGSPSFPTDTSVERLYTHLEVLFATASRHFRGCTLAEFYELQACGRAQHSYCAPAAR